MAIYDNYSARARVGAGVKLKQGVAARIFAMGLAPSAATVCKVLELGPGDGYISELSRNQGVAYTAVEGSAEIAAALRRRGVQVLEGYVPPLPAALKGQFSACFMLHVLEHMAGPQAAATLLDEIRAKLLPGGTLTIVCPAFEHWGARFYDCDYTHSFPLTRRRLEQLLRDQGFELVVNTVHCGPGFGRRWIALSWFARLLWPAWLDALVGHRVPGDLLNRGLLSFMPNLVMVARKPQAVNLPAADQDPA